MTVAPVQDLIVDVMAAADPASRRVAASRLERLASTAEQDFAATVDRKIEAGALDQQGMAAQNAGSGSGAALDLAGHATIIKPSGGNAAVYRKFEAFILQMFVESMLPKDANEVFGKGTAGTIWRSMLAEQIGNEMSKGNGIGIAKQLAKSRAAADAAAAG
ncbi:rod-binding protein [Rhodopseudomonas palustris]|uniref:Flagellar protein FlgJ N-terminal domain-containing protein n=1 Tax=Rhodopseudomonas palustris (strain BisB18) TaxID=316056 RepID=Q21AA1_RHOPB